MQRFNHAIPNENCLLLLLFKFLSSVRNWFLFFFFNYERSLGLAGSLKFALFQLSGSSKEHSGLLQVSGSY